MQEPHLAASQAKPSQAKPSVFFERASAVLPRCAGDARRRTLSPSVIRNRLAELARTSKQLAGRPRRADNQPRTTINIPVELPDLLTHFRIAAREGTSLPPLTPEDASARRSFLRRPLADVTSDLGIQSSGLGAV